MGKFVDTIVALIFFVSLISVAVLAIKYSPIFGSCMVGLTILSFLYGLQLVKMRKKKRSEE